MKRPKIFRNTLPTSNESADSVFIYTEGNNPLDDLKYRVYARNGRSPGVERLATVALAEDAKIVAEALAAHHGKNLVMTGGL